jgi:hypothetical protein
MLDEGKSGMQCAEFDALLAEAIDGTLSGERREEFERHRAGCAACNTLFAEVASGAAWLDEVVEAEPPRKLVHNILAATNGAEQLVTKAVPQPSVWERLRRELGMAFAPVLTPRFGMSMGMAFFSIMLMLNMAQIRIKDLTPHNLSHTFYSSENKVMKYYENTRLVYEIESRVRELRNTGEGEREEEYRRMEKNNNRTQQQKSEPERRQEMEFSRDQDGQVLASLVQSFKSKEENPEMIARQRREL